MSERKGSTRSRSRVERQPLPLAQTEGVLSTDFGEEIVVYDSRTHKAHCLNRSAAVVYRHLDGRTSMTQMVSHLRGEVEGAADEDMVWLALRELDRNELLAEPLEMAGPQGLSRRALIRRLGIAAAVVPVVASMTAPAAEAQVSATGCRRQEPDCEHFSCDGGCACIKTTEGFRVCVVPSCVSPCDSSADCPPGHVCFASGKTIGCCGKGNVCVPICPPGGAPPDIRAKPWSQANA